MSGLAGPAGGRTADPEGLRVLLVSMPFGPLERPSLGLGLLQAGAERAGFDCSTRYLGFGLAERIGLTTYQWISHQLPYDAFIGEWLFAEALHGADPVADERYGREILRGQWDLDAEAIATLAIVRSACTEYVADLGDLVPWSDHDVIGFTSTFHQNLAVLATAAEVRRRHPDAIIVAGGANWEGEMGQALLENHRWIDHACSGEADRSFIRLLGAVAEGTSPAGIPGVLTAGRPGDQTDVGGDPIHDLDELPVPDFAPYQDQLAASSFAGDITPTLLLETARGCWWGAVSHCTFCGLNGETLSFRSKSPDRVIDEFDHLASTWQADTVSVVDNILDMRYFRTVLPRLAERTDKPSLFWEVKASLSRRQVRQLAEAGVGVVQPGIESLADEILTLMAKGTTGIQNVALLKWCREYGVTPEWNLLYGFPGEDPADYERMRALLPALHHLSPPSGAGPIRVDRFSPYHRDPDGHDLVDLTPAQPFRHIYPGVTEEDLSRIAYYFDFRYRDGRQPRGYVEGALQAVETWRRRHPTVGFWLLRNGDELVLSDHRGRRPRTARLGGWKAALYDACDRPRSRAELDQLEATGGVAPQLVDAFLERCRQTGAMMTDGRRHLALAVARPARYDDEPIGLRRLPLTVHAEPHRAPRRAPTLEEAGT